MATNFPTSLDTLTNPASTDPLSNPDHATQHANGNDAIEALEAKVGVDSSAVSTSLDYKIARRVRTDADNTLDEGVDIAVGTTTGSKIGTATSQKLGFFNATPVVQPSAYTQTYATADKTHANSTYSAPAQGQAAITGGESPTEAEFNALRTDLIATNASLAALAVDVADLKQLVNSVIDDLQALGLVG